MMKLKAKQSQDKKTVEKTGELPINSIKCSKDLFRGASQLWVINLAMFVVNLKFKSYALFLNPSG